MIKKSSFYLLNNFKYLWYYINLYRLLDNGELKMKETEKQIEELRDKLNQLVKDLDGLEKNEILGLSQELDKVLNDLLDKKQIDDK